MTRFAWPRPRPDRWLFLTVLGASVVTLVEAFLLQRRYSLFTGGFLSDWHLEGVVQIAVFLVTSFVVDAAVIGMGAALVLAVASWLGVTRSAAVLAFIVPVGSLLAVDFVQYRLVEYLGDAFDLELMFDLTGRDLGEVLAVSVDYLVLPATVFLGLAVALGVVAWLVERRAQRQGYRSSSITRFGLRRGVVLFAAAAVLSTGVRLSNEQLDGGVRRKPAGQVMGALVRTVTDFDRDGFGLLRHPTDPSPWNGAIYPYAVEIPGNGIDENGVGGDLPRATAPAPPGLRRVPAFVQTPNVVLVVLESFRGDLIGATHRGRPVTPTLNALARRGQSVDRAYSHNGYTVQSRFHLMSGALVHGSTETTLVDDFQANGYEVAYFSGQDESYGGPEMGVGFDRADVAYDARDDQDLRYSEHATAGSLAVSHTLVRHRLQGFLGARTTSRPLFLYLSLHDTHFPYHHGEIEPPIDPTVVPRGDIVPARADDLWAMYVNTAANVDRTLGLILCDVEAAVDGPLVVLVTSDHGESLFDESYLGHGYALNEAQTRIPMIAVNLPAPLPEPFGQSHLRETLWHAFEAGPRATTVTSLDSSGRIFQYLGTLAYPRQIAHTDGRRRTTYDFRTSLARVGDGDWQKLDTLSPIDETEVVSLIRDWESMRLAAQPPTSADVTTR